MLRIVSILALTWFVVAEVPSDEERKQIAECHTKLREEVQPTASNMQLMSYSSEMEKLTDEFLASCPGTFPNADRNPQYKDVSYIVSSTEADKPQFAVEVCKLDEGEYDFEKNTCTGDCTWYKQRVWATTNQFGCAKKICPKSSDPAKTFTMFACLYKPS
uniref:SCP domain-containing protein n=1 Tax=Mesocestoides corti TaxID=53468 RepID=A0A5K3G0E3_MESCO